MTLALKLQAEKACRLCRRSNRELSRHRLVPGRLGGRYRAKNVVPLCRQCHDDVEASDPVARRMLRDMLWPEEVAYAIGLLGRKWFDATYPQRGMPSVELVEADRLAGYEVRRSRRSRYAFDFDSRPRESQVATPAAGDATPTWRLTRAS